MTQLDLRHFIRVYDADLDAPLCARMIESFNALQRYQQSNGRGVRAGLDESAWTELNVTRMSDAAFITSFRQRISRALHRYNSDVGLPLAIPDTPLLSDLVLKRYRPGQGEQFQVHFDAINHVANRYLVILWYLNDVAAGGVTHFPQLDIAIEPRAGRLLMFPPYWMYQHAGLPPVSEPKYILSTYLLFPMPGNPTDRATDAAAT